MRNLWLCWALASSAVAIPSVVQAQAAGQLAIVFPNGGTGCTQTPPGNGARQVINFDCSQYYGGIVRGQAISLRFINRVTLLPTTTFVITNFIDETNNLPGKRAQGEIVFRVPQNVATSGQVFTGMSLRGQFYDSTSLIFNRLEQYSIAGNVTSDPLRAPANTLYAYTGNISPYYPKYPNPLPFSVLNSGFITVYDPNYLYIGLGFATSAFFTPTITGIRMPGSFHTVIGSDAASATFVPEPGTWLLMTAGFGAVGLAARRRKPALPA